MDEFTSILFFNMLINAIVSIIIVFLAIGLFKGKDYTSKGDKINYKNKYIQFFVVRIVPIIMVLFSVYMNYAPITDYYRRDYLSNQAILEDFSAPKNSIFSEKLYFKDDSEVYNFPKKNLGKIILEKGKKYQFVYARRTKIILKMELVNSR
jgi:hypothetical protein